MVTHQARRAAFAAPAGSRIKIAQAIPAKAGWAGRR